MLLADPGGDETRRNLREIHLAGTYWGKRSLQESIGILGQIRHTGKILGPREAPFLRRRYISATPAPARAVQIRSCLGLHILVCRGCGIKDGGGRAEGRGLLGMRFPVFPHPEERPKGASRRMEPVARDEASRDTTEKKSPRHQGKARGGMSRFAMRPDYGTQCPVIRSND
jgi:hypothetical protein